MSLLSNHPLLMDINLVDWPNGNMRSNINKEIGPWAGNADTASWTLSTMPLLDSVVRTRAYTHLMVQGLSLTRTGVDYDEICSRNGYHYTPLLCQFGSFWITEHAAYECGHNNISTGSEIYMKVLNGLHSSESSGSRPQDHAFAKGIETRMDSTWFGRDMVNYVFACSFRIYMDSWWIKRC